MGTLSDYLFSFTGPYRYKRSVSRLALWNRETKLPKNVYIAFGARLAFSEVGEYTRIRHFATLHYAKVGKFSTISKSARIGIGQHPTNMISTNLIFYKKNPITEKWVRPIDFAEYEPINIGNDVWIGEGALIMGGVTIGDGAIVGARSVVHRDIPPYAIATGLPARVVKYRFDDETIEYLLNLKWWDFHEKKIEEHLKAFTVMGMTKPKLMEFFNK